VSENLKKAMLSYRLFNKNYIILANVVDTELFIPIDKNEKSNKIQFVHLSCFTDSHKNISGILRVLKKLSKTHTDFHCTLIGDGPDFEMLKSFAKELLLENLITFTGLLEGKKVVEQLQKADAMLIFSNHENLPVVMLESYACGVPVISTNVGGIHEHMNTDLGRLVERGDENAFLSELKTFIENPEIYNQQKIRDYAIQHFSKKKIGKELHHIYLTALEEK